MSRQHELEFFLIFLNFHTILFFCNRLFEQQGIAIFNFFEVVVSWIFKDQSLFLIFTPFTNLLDNFRPVHTGDENVIRYCKKNTSNGHPDPQTLNSHFFVQAKVPGKRDSEHLVGYNRAESSLCLPTGSAYD